MPDSILEEQPKDNNRFNVEKTKKIINKEI